MLLSQMKAPRGSSKRRTRVGRGQASGLGKTAGRGGKGQKARSGNMRFEGFEGGQSPLQRRLPKFGFNNVFRKEYEEVQVSDLDLVTSGPIDAASLRQAGLIRGTGDGVVILGKGTIKSAHTVKVNRVTGGAREAIEKAGGKIELLPPRMTKGQKEKEAKRQAPAKKAE
jgi:large subunit ribosomal protein L15